MTEIQEELFALRDAGYAEFSARAIPTVPVETIIGVRVPVLKNYFREYRKRPDAMEFIQELPHRYFEEYELHGLLLCTMKDFDECVREVERFLPYIDNWSVCDALAPKCFEKNKEKVYQKVQEWVRSDHTYTVRFGIKCLLGFLNDEDFSTEQLDLVCTVRSEEYYVKMMVAWYFATALAKQYEKTLPYIEKHRLSDWEHRKSIQKAVESYRIPDDRKEYLKSLRKAKCE